MRCISLHQPWASLVAIGAKTIETRSWATSYRGPLAIHAAKVDRSANLLLSDPVMAAAAELALRRSGWTTPLRLGGLPRGAVVATCVLADCLLIDPTGIGPWLSRSRRSLPDRPELLFGDYRPGRFAWVLTDIVRLPEPVPCRGHQGLFEWQPPAGVTTPAST